MNKASLDKNYDQLKEDLSNRLKKYPRLNDIYNSVHTIENAFSIFLAKLRESRFKHIFCCRQYLIALTNFIHNCLGDKLEFNDSANHFRESIPFYLFFNREKLLQYFSNTTIDQRAKCVVLIWKGIEYSIPWKPNQFRRYSVRLVSSATEQTGPPIITSPEQNDDDLQQNSLSEPVSFDSPENPTDDSETLFEPTQDQVIKNEMNDAYYS